jgi:quinol monooxygenase YgiN
MHAFITHMRAKPGKREEVVALTTVMLEKTRTEEGIPVYVFSTDADSPDDFWFYDIYESEAARSAHESSAEFARTMPSLMQVADIVSVNKLVPYGPMKITPVSGSRR